MKTVLKIGLVIGALLLVGCGGGGGTTTSSVAGITYEGKTDKAVLTEESSAYFLDLLNASFTQGISIPTYGKLQKTTSIEHRNYKRIGELIQSYKIIDSDTIDGEISGRLSVVVEETGTYTGTITYKYENYSDVKGYVFNGTLVNYLTVNSAEIITKSVIEYQSFNVKLQDEDITIDGKFTATPTTTGSKIVENYVAKNNKTSEMIKYDDFIVLLNSRGQVLEYSGKIFDSNYGYVDVQTLVPLAYNNDGSRKAEGEVLLDGENSSTTVKYAYDNRIRVEIDANKDGTVDDVQVYREGNYETQVPNAAPVITITFPQSIYTDTDMSEVQVHGYDPDLDGFEINYEWTVKGVSKSTTLVLDSTLFVKHDILKLTVAATDDRKSTGSKEKEQEVLNTSPVASIDSNITDEKIEALSSVSFDASSSTDIDNDKLTYEWKVYKYIHEEEHRGEPIIATIWPDDLDPNGDIVYPNLIIEVNASKYFSDTSAEKPIFGANAEGKHIVLCTVFDDDMAEGTTEMNVTIKPLDIIESNDSKIFFYNQDSLYEWENDGIIAIDLNNDDKKELLYITRDPADLSKKLLHITYDAMEESSTQSYEFNSSIIYENLHVQDLNADGRVDIIFGAYNQQYVMVQNISGTFDAPQKQFIWGELTLIDDVTGDGKVDGVRLDKCTLEIYTNFDNYDEKIQYEVGECDKVDVNGQDFEHTLKIADFNNDGIMDYLIYSYSLYDGSVELVVVYKDNQENLVQSDMSKFPSGTHSGMFSLGDMNNDGFNDILIGFILLESNQDLTFTQLKSFEPYDNAGSYDSIVIVDINNDGKKDILYETSYVLRVLVQSNNYQMHDFEIKNVILNKLISDIDNDGKVEIIENYHNRIQITSLK